MKISERLIERLRQDGQALPPCTELRRTNRNHQTDIGAWSWLACCPRGCHGDLHVGSHWPMRVLLAAPALTYQTLGCGDICVDPVTDQPEG